MNTSINLADPGVWDDRALINSWNEALEEYKKYHSIHVQKKSLADVLTDEELIQLKMERRELRKGPAVTAVEAPKETTEDNNDDVEMDVSADEETQESTALSRSTIAENPALRQQSEPGQSQETAAATVKPMPQTLLDSVQDESLRNMMMSWYYAGYYTGLHEGQQKAKTQG
ncbi:hypothetical protein FKW77_004097 [Venturia effusa]|uniref:Survival Motor Neuron Gemin2-binding domain-containing protein n=1 Tax=Venturia effusa TaxID=50376 RepID=A0A517LLA7_9PEZI|nr:hypothetical protein FKW77_004097 [Venturia effusa]